MSALFDASFVTRLRSALKPSAASLGLENDTAIRRPVVRGYAAVAFFYYLVTGILLLFLDDGHLNFIMTPFRVSAVCFAAFIFVWTKEAKSIARLEIAAVLVSLHVLINTTVNDIVDFSPDNFDGFELCIIVFCATTPSLRGAITLTLATLVCWLSIVVTHAPNLLGTNVESAIACISVGMIICTLVNFSLRRASQAVRNAELLAKTDGLTGLPNRRYFFSALDQAIEQRTLRETTLALCLIDLDGFKPINDSYGHAAGDALLTEVGKRLSSATPAGSLVARLGGDEFAVLLPVGIAPEAAEAVGNTICNTLRQPFLLPQITAQISGSLGLILSTKEAWNANAFIERADFALYFAKKKSRGTCVLFTDQHEDELSTYAFIDRALRDDAVQNEFYMVLQPQYDLKLGKTIGFEALGRWRNPMLGNIRPDTFIRIAEASGQINRITHILFRKTLDVFAHIPGDLYVSFNLSGHDLMSSETIDDIIQMIVDHDVATQRIEFEITETALMTDFAQARQSIERLSRLGCRIALDDFGSGYSSFSYIHNLPVGKIKIDRSFVVSMGTSEAASKIVRTLIDLAANLKMNCVVEGVETQAEVAVLQQMKARYIQGYVFGRPMETHQIQPFLLAEMAPRTRIAREEAPSTALAEPDTSPKLENVIHLPRRRSGHK